MEIKQRFLFTASPKSGTDRNHVDFDDGYNNNHLQITLFKTCLTADYCSKPRDADESEGNRTSTARCFRHLVAIAEGHTSPK